MEGQGYSLATDLISSTLYRLDTERIGRTGNLLAPPILYTIEEAVEFALLRKLLQRMNAEN